MFKETTRLLVGGGRNYGIMDLRNYGITESRNYGIMELRRASLVLRQTTRLLVNKTTSVASLVLRRQRTTELGLRQVSTDDYVDM